MFSVKGNRVAKLFRSVTTSTVKNAFSCALHLPVTNSAGNKEGLQLDLL